MRQMGEAALVSAFFLFLAVIGIFAGGVQAGRIEERENIALNGPGIKLCEGESVKLGQTTWTAVKGTIPISGGDNAGP
ncbi:MAG: hypothetical protein AAB262_10795 [Elusimicrobiota bacterium]